MSCHHDESCFLKVTQGHLRPLRSRVGTGTGVHTAGPGSVCLGMSSSLKSLDVPSLPGLVSGTSTPGFKAPSCEEPRWAFPLQSLTFISVKCGCRRAPKLRELNVTHLGSSERAGRWVLTAVPGAHPAGSPVTPPKSGGPGPCLCLCLCLLCLWGSRTPEELL